ncbi:MAG TPA: nicotinate phosphoribosyltransferase, partial [Spirochaetales bacterium]|nr:nicotinate phosphoribosyltransferase [Spirochaetales bacterium]
VERDHARIVQRAIEVRGIRSKVSHIPIPVPFSAAFEGERVRKADMHVQFGGKYSPAFEYLRCRAAAEVTDGAVTVHGPEIDAMAEGEIVFPQEPILRVHGGLVEAQLVEGLILNTINFQSLIATKATRLVRAAAGSQIMEFGLRRAQGANGAMAASRAAYIGGASSTSNALAARLYGIQASGTMAHSWIMTFPSELAAFQAYAQQYPDSSVFLIDTYDTLASGIKNAITVGRGLAARGKRFGVRLDSGDMDYLSRRVRQELDQAGLHDAYIVASNELEEEIIETLSASKAPIDVWGVGTRLVTGGSDSSFTGVYKLAQIDRRVGERFESVPVMKFSENPEKSTNPGVKDSWRLYDDDGCAVADVISQAEDTLTRGQTRDLYHPYLDTRRFSFSLSREPRRLLSKVMENGRLVGPEQGAKDILAAARAHREQSLAELDPSYLRILNPHRYRVALSDGMRNLKLGFSEILRKEHPGA